MTAENISEYQRQLNFKTGEATAIWTQKDGTFQRKIFTSGADTLIVMQIVNTAKFDCSLELKNRPVAWNQWDLENPEITGEIIKWLSANDWSNSLATYHDPGGLFNINLSGAFQYVIIKAIVNSQKDYIALLPALPVEWEKGVLKGILLRNQLYLENLSWEVGQINSTLISEIDQKISLKLPENFANATIFINENQMDKKADKGRMIPIAMSKHESVSILITKQK